MAYVKDWINSSVLWGIKPHYCYGTLDSMDMYIDIINELLYLNDLKITGGGTLFLSLSLYSFCW